MRKLWVLLLWQGAGVQAKPMATPCSVGIRWQCLLQQALACAGDNVCVLMRWTKVVGFVPPGTMSSPTQEIMRL